MLERIIRLILRDIKLSRTLWFRVLNVSYKIRAEHLNMPFYSDVFVQTDVTIDIPYAVANVHVTDTGADVENAHIRVFRENGNYTGVEGYTNASGAVSLDLPAAVILKFRAEYDQVQYWLDPLILTAHQENQVDMALDLLALTQDPAPGKILYGGSPAGSKQKAKDPVLLASIGSLAGILAHTTPTQLPGAVYYFINDHLGTPAKVVDDDGVVVWDADYLPFGETNILTGTFDNKFRFPGQYLDDETGWHYNYHRYYDPGVGRYLRADPVGFYADDMTLYRYVSNNPVIFSDRGGLYCGSGWSEWVVLDRPAGYNFSMCCYYHDECYGSHCEKNQDDCDKEFLDCMIRECFFHDLRNPSPDLNNPIYNSRKPDDFRYVGPHISECIRIAKYYFKAVKRWGGGPFEDGRILMVP